MTNAAKLDVEEPIISDGSSPRSSKGYYLTKKAIMLCLVVFLIILILVALLAAYFGPGRGSSEKEWSRGTPAGTPKSTKEPSSQSSPPSSTTTTASSNVPYSNIRLPKYVEPEWYKILLNVDMKQKTVTGNSTIAVKVTKASRYMIIHAYDFSDIEGVVRDTKTGKVIPAMKDFLYDTNQYHVMEFEKELPPGMYHLEYKFQYELKKNLKGFYQSSYKTKDGTEKFVAATQFEPVDARTAFPCFDEPAMKAVFDITMTNDHGYHSISNMPIKKRYQRSDLTWYTEFGTSPKMPTYLLAFVVCDFANKTVYANGMEKNISMTYFAPKEQIGQIAHAMDVGSKILPFFETYYNVSYPLAKADMVTLPEMSFGAMEHWGLITYRMSRLLYSPTESATDDKIIISGIISHELAHQVDMIAIPDFAAGAMENWGLITYRAVALLYDSLQSGISSQQYVSGVVSHELAHQWFGNIVTMDWWSDLWLNEGFASYVEYLGRNATEDWDVLDFQVIDDVAQGLALDALVTSHPVYVEVEHPDEINEIFDSISYQKGGSILRMLDDLLGPGVFKKGLNIYLNKHSYGNAKTNDLWKSLSEGSKLHGDRKNVSNIMDSWINQMGFPVVNVTTETDGSFTLTQSRFLRDPKPDLSKSKYTSPFNYTWVIPFNYMVLNISDMSNIQVLTEKQRQWMEFKGATIKPNKIATSSDILVKGNVGQYGFFRVNYDTEGWQKIIRVLKANHQIFDVKDRAGLLGDAFALANSGRLNFKTALDLFDYIHKDTDYIPWKSAINSISFIPSILTQTRPAQKHYSKYMLNKVKPLFDQYGFKDTPNILERYLQILIVQQACANGVKECINNATDLFQKFMSDPDKHPVPADFRSMVYHYGVQYGGEKEWDFLFKRYLNNKIASEKTKLMYGMSAIQESWMLERWLHMGLNESIVKSQDASYVFSYVATSNPIGRYSAWNFMKNNWEKIAKRFSKSFFTIRRIFSSVTSGFTTQYELDQVNAFVQSKVTNPGTAKRIISQSIEKITANIEWLNTNEATIESWLEDKANTM